MKKLFLSLIFSIFYTQLFSNEQIENIKKAANFLSPSDDEIIELSFQLTIAPFYSKDYFKKLIESLEKDENNYLYQHKNKIIGSYKDGQDYIKILSEQQKKDRIQEINHAYELLKNFGLNNFTKKQILDLLEKISKLNNDQIKDIKKALNVLSLSAEEDETIELSFTLAIIPFSKKSTVDGYINILEKNHNHPLYPYKKQILHAYKAGQDYVKTLSEKQKDSQVQEIGLAYKYLKFLGLNNFTKKQILDLLKKASLDNENNASKNTNTPSSEKKDTAKSSNDLFILNDESNELIDALKILEIDISKLKKLIPLTLIDDYYANRVNEYKEVGKYSDKDFENIEKAYSFLKNKSFYIDNAKK